MARQEATSIFSDGLMSDLHPINTPKSVLTDCLNGTYITYNGNEFLLQNDMGNYKLKNCRLPVNFIPVGVKGYADILYIVSYNPITKEVEIGSYPAPQSIFSTENSTPSIDNNSLLSPFTFGEGVQTFEYPKYINDNKKTIYIFQGENEDDYKLYPGDEFRLRLDDNTDLASLEYIYQHLNFYIIDEDNKLYDIDDTQIYEIDSQGHLQLTTNRFKKVFWETPGWLAAQWDLYVPDKFNLNLRSLNVPEFLVQHDTETLVEAGLRDQEAPSGQFKVSMDLSAQTIITDSLFRATLMERINKTKDYVQFIDLKTRFLIKQDTDYGNFQGIENDGLDIYSDSQIVKNGITYHVVDIACKNHNYQDDIITAYVNAFAVWFFDIPETIANFPGKIEIIAYPIIDYNNKILEFTQFSTSFSFNLNNIKDAKNIKIAENIYKWSVDDDSCTISFNVEGPFVNASDITGHYEISKIIENDSGITVSDTPVISNQTISNLVLFGQNTLNIAFNDIGFTRAGGLYQLRIWLQQGEEIITGAERKLILIPSSIFNDWFGVYDNYLNSITYSMWVEKFLDLVTISTPIIDNLTPVIKKNLTLDDGWIEYKWSNDSKNYRYLNSDNVSKEIEANVNSRSTAIQLINQLYHFKYPNHTTINDDTTELTWHAAVEQNTSTLQLKINYGKLIDGFTGTLNWDITLEENGELWNAIYDATLNLRSNISNIPELVIEKDNSNSEFEFSFANLSNEYIINCRNDQRKQNLYTNFSPYFKSYLNKRKPWDQSDPEYCLYSYGHDGSTGQKIDTFYTQSLFSGPTDAETVWISSTHCNAKKQEFIKINDSTNYTVRRFDENFSLPCYPIHLRCHGAPNKPAANWVTANQNERNKYIESLGYDASDGNASTQPHGDYLIFKTPNVNGSSPIPIVLDCTAKDQGSPTNKLLAILSLAIVRVQSNASTTYYFPELLFDGTFIEENNYTYTQYRTEFILDRLRWGSQYIFYSTESRDYKDGRLFPGIKGVDSGILFQGTTQNIINKKQSQSVNLNNPLIMNFEYTICVPYRNFIENDIISLLNKNTTDKNNWTTNDFVEIQFYTNQEELLGELQQVEDITSEDLNNFKTFMWGEDGDFQRFALGNTSSTSLLTNYKSFFTKAGTQNYNNTNVRYTPKSTNPLVLKAVRIVRGSEGIINNRGVIEAAYYEEFDVK